MIDVSGVHPYADQYPMLDDDELAALADSIAEQGQLSPVVVTPDGLILDGRNRWAACNMLGIDCAAVTVTADPESWADLVIASNSTRRHMSTGARAMADALVLQVAGRRRDGRWARGTILDDRPISSGEQKALKQCGVVLDYAPGLATQVRDGALTLNAAYERANAERAKVDGDRKDAERATKMLKAKAKDDDRAAKYVRLIDVDELEPRAALAAYNEDTRKEREQAETERCIRSDLYSGIARAVQVCAGYGGYADIPKLMADYDPTELAPPQLDDEMSVETLTVARRLIDELIDWRKNL